MRNNTIDFVENYEYNQVDANCWDSSVSGRQTK